ncbi:MAG: ComF family protein [bacterium]|nr:ComF family protein [bacterium]
MHSLSLAKFREWSFWSLVFPSRCVYCAKEMPASNILFCDRCWAELPRAEKTPTEKLPRYVDRVHAGFAYREGGITREIVHALKFDGHTSLVPKMADFLIRTIPAGYLNSDDVWTPVPLHWLRFGDRSFNQSLLLCRELTNRTGGEIVPLLKRTRNTPAQSGQGFRTRAQNVKDAFRYSHKGEAPKSVLLIDDVVTTGATVSECARILKASGVEQVRVLAFARAVS